MEGDCQLGIARDYRLLMADVYELAGTSRRTSESLAQSSNLTVARWNVISVVSGQAATVPAIADRLGQARQSVQAVVHEAIELGLLMEQANPGHRRSPLIAATPAGRERLRQAEASADRLRSRQLRRAGVTASEVDTARKTLRRLLEAIAEDNRSRAGSGRVDPA